MGKTGEIASKGFVVAAVELMITKNRKIGNSFFADGFMEGIEVLPFFLRTASSGKVAQVYHKCRFSLGDFIKDQTSFSIIPFTPEFPVTRPLRIADQDKFILRRNNL